jgi:hypothetical protein
VQEGVEYEYAYNDVGQLVRRIKPKAQTPEEAAAAAAALARLKAEAAARGKQNVRVSAVCCCLCICFFWRQLLRLFCQT